MQNKNRGSVLTIAINSLRQKNNVNHRHPKRTFSNNSVQNKQNKKESISLNK